MIKSTQYFTSVLLMLVVFAMFVSLERISAVFSVEVDRILPSQMGQDTAFQGEQTDAESKALADNSYVLILASESSRYGMFAQQWCDYQKRAYYRVDSPDDAPDETPAIVFVDPDRLMGTAVVARLQAMHAQGAVLIFAGLPSGAVVDGWEGLKELLGIQAVKKTSFALDGEKLFSGFLLGAEYVFAEMEPSVPYYTLKAGSKVYMVGLMDEQGDTKNEQLPPIIWRYSDGGAPVFAVNESFGQDMTALGLYTAMAAESASYALYPVVNAQNMVTVNYPNLSVENDEVMQTEYNMTAWQFSRDYLWQNITMIYDASKDKLVCAVSPQLSLDEDCIDYTLLDWYAAKIKEESGEMVYAADLRVLGLGGDEENTLKRRLSALSGKGGLRPVLYSNVTETLRRTLLREPALADTTAVLSSSDNVLAYLDNSRVGMGFTYDAFQNADRDQLRMVSMFTALGYSSVKADVEELLYPEDENSAWSVLGDTWGSYHVTWWKPFSAFMHCNITETESRVRRFLSVDYASQRVGDRITLTIDNYEQEAWFILRLNGEMLTDSAGCTLEKIGTNTWLVCAQQENAAFTVRQEDRKSE